MRRIKKKDQSDEDVYLSSLQLKKKYQKLLIICQSLLFDWSEKRVFNIQKQKFYHLVKKYYTCKNKFVQSS